MKNNYVAYHMHSDASLLDGLSKVKDMEYMFANSKFNGDISKWDVGKVKNMYSMFANSEFDNDISKWNINKNCSITNIFFGCPIKEAHKPKFIY